MPNTNAVGPEVRQFILSSLPPSKAQKQLALVVVLGMLAVVFIVTGPLSYLRTSPVPAFLPIYVTTMIATDAITAILLFTQFVILRSRAVLVIAIGYAFAALGSHSVSFDVSRSVWHHRRDRWSVEYGMVLRSVAYWLPELCHRLCVVEGCRCRTKTRAKHGSRDGSHECRLGGQPCRRSDTPE